MVNFNPFETTEFGPDRFQQHVQGEPKVRPKRQLHDDSPPEPELIPKRQFRVDLRSDAETIAELQITKLQKRIAELEAKLQKINQLL